MDQPVVFHFNDYRKFLGQVYLYMKGKRSGFSYRVFSRLAGISSPNFLKLVIEGNRNLTKDTQEKFAKALKLKSEEKRFFIVLVHFNQSKTPRTRQLFAERLMKFKAYQKFYPLRKSEYDYYIQWYNVAIREMIGIAGYESNPEKIASSLRPAVSVQEVKVALNELVRLGLIKENSGKFTRTSKVIQTKEEVFSGSIAQFHRNMIRLGSQAIDRFPRDEREISCITVGVTAAKAAQIKIRIQEFQRELLAISSNEANADKVMQINFQLFPLMERKPEKE